MGGAVSPHRKDESSEAAERSTAAPSIAAPAAAMRRMLPDLRTVVILLLASLSTRRGTVSGQGNTDAAGDDDFVGTTSASAGPAGETTGDDDFAIAGTPAPTRANDDDDFAPDAKVSKADTIYSGVRIPRVHKPSHQILSGVSETPDNCFKTADR